MTKRRSLHDFKIEVEPFGATVYFYSDEDNLKRAVKKAAPHFEEAESFDGYGGCTYQLTNLTFHVGVFEQTLNVITHECLHVVMSLMDDVGVDPKCQETYCYTLGTLVDKAFAGYVKLAKKRREAEEKQPEEHGDG